MFRYETVPMLLKSRNSGIHPLRSSTFLWPHKFYLPQQLGWWWPLKSRRDDVNRRISSKVSNGNRNLNVWKQSPKQDLPFRTLKFKIYRKSLFPMCTKYNTTILLGREFRRCTFHVQAPTGTLKTGLLQHVQSSTLNPTKSVKCFMICPHLFLL